jgi:hypothetical protein
MSDWTWNNKSKLKNMNSHYIPCRFRRNVKFRDQSGGIPGLHPDSGRNTRGRVKTSKKDCAENYGRWTEYREARYRRRLLDIEQHGAQPEPVSRWRDQLRGFKETRSFNKNMEKLALKFLNEDRPDMMHLSCEWISKER